jgi:hypothetical protein
MTKPQSNAKKFAKRVISILLPIFSTLFLIGTTIIIIVIVNGYSIDITNRSLVKTGVLNIETNPSDAAVFIDSEYSGNTNRAFPNMNIGTYKIDIVKDGYYQYQRRMDIRHGLATILSVPLIKQTGAEVITIQNQNDIIFSNESGVYRLSAVENPETTPTAAPQTTSKVYRLTHFTVQTSFFEPPKPLTEEQMDIDLPANYKITDFSASPTGKNILIFYQNEKEQKFVHQVAFVRGKKELIIPGATAILDTYIREADNKLAWSPNADYILIETKTQLISYNIKTGARIILFEKPATEAQNFIWNTYQEGIILVRKTPVQASSSPTPSFLTEGVTYDIDQISFNGNLLDAKFTKIPVNGEPTAVWIHAQTDLAMIVLVTDKGSYLIGNVYENRVGEYEVTSNSTTVADKEIVKITQNIVSININNNPVKNVQFVPDKFMLSYTDSSEKNLYVFTFNKRSAEHYINLGEKNVVANSNTEIRPQDWAFNSHYILYESDKKLFAVDFLGNNVYQLQHGVNKPAFYNDKSTIVYLGDDGKFYFKVLR